MPFCLSERALVRVSTVRHHAGDRHASFLADFLGNCAIAFPICPLMPQNARSVTSGLLTLDPFPDPYRRRDGLLGFEPGTVHEYRSITYGSHGSVAIGTQYPCLPGKRSIVWATQTAIRGV
jgi:hypothetical protein